MSTRRGRRLPWQRATSPAPGGRLSAARLDAMLDGRDVDSDQLARLLETARRPGSDSELAGLAAARAAFVSSAGDDGIRDGSGEPVSGGEGRRGRLGLRAVGLATASLGATVGVAAAAAAGVAGGVVVVSVNHHHHHHRGPASPSGSATATPSGDLSRPSTSGRPTTSSRAAPSASPSGRGSGSRARTSSASTVARSGSADVPASRPTTAPPSVHVSVSVHPSLHASVSATGLP